MAGDRYVLSNAVMSSATQMRQADAVETCLAQNLLSLKSCEF